MKLCESKEFDVAGFGKKKTRDLLTLHFATISFIFLHFSEKKEKW